MPPKLNTSRSRPPLLVRHRWLNRLDAGFFRCWRSAVPLYRSPDPICPGTCGARIDWRDIDYPKCYQYDPKPSKGSLANALLEDIGVRLDLKAAELAAEAGWRRATA